jgi:pyrimidine-nucleoside phosphorylase
MRMYEIIENKRDGKALSNEEIEFFIKGYTEGSIPDYQASALLMAIFLNGMNGNETVELTNAMANSGDVVDLSPIEGIKVDKHSTGGVGDKTTLVLGPIVAACGVPVAKMSGRGLGHTGGTIDKLKSIPGFHTGVEIENFIKNVKEIGICVAGQTGNLAPADKKLYALRDVTATVNSISLIASSIMSKKIASGADCIVLDVKTGSGAFMKTLEESIKLASAMVEIGKNTGRNTVAYVTEMDIPLGFGIGNSLEVIEAIDTLKGKGPEDLQKVAYALAAKMLNLAGIGDDSECKRMVIEAVNSGRALDKFKEMVISQGGNPEVTEDYNLFGNAQYIIEVKSESEGYICHINTEQIGKVSVILGAGRETKESKIDLTAGIELFKKTGDRVSKGDVLAVLHTNKHETILEATHLFLSSYSFQKEPILQKPLIRAFVDSKGVEIY